MRGSLLALGLASALIAHLAVEAASPALTVACIALVALVVLLPGLARGSPKAWAAVLATAGALAFAGSRRWIWLPLYAPPVLGDFFAAWLFGHTLAIGRTPLVESFIQRMRDEAVRPLDPDVAHYARRLTFGWTMLFSVLGGTSLVLALLAVPNGVLILLGFSPPLPVPQTVWSWFANIAEYGIAAAFFVVEFAYRRVRFPHQRHTDFLSFVRKLRVIAPSLVELASPASRPTSRTESVE